MLSERHFYSLLPRGRACQCGCNSCCVSSICEVPAVVSFEPEYVKSISATERLTRLFPCPQDRYRMTMGLEPMRPDRWIEIDDDYEEDMAQRKKLLAEKRDIVLHSRPEVY